MPVLSHTVFSAGDIGQWRIESIDPVVGESLTTAPFLSIARPGDSDGNADWALTGVASNGRYVQKSEVAALHAAQDPLGRPHANRAALIPIRKNEEWWQLAQDERRKILEEQSHHIGIGLEYLPAIARKLYHCRDLLEPFDFLTWFEYAPEHADAFEELVRRLRATAEWAYVDREVDIRLIRTDAVG